MVFREVRVRGCYRRRSCLWSAGVLLRLGLMVLLGAWVQLAMPGGLAAQGGEAATQGDPHGGSESWLQPVPALQVEQDPHLRPAATGGIFVPAMSSGQAEPQFQVLQGEHLVAETRTGSMVYVLPGLYTVLVGSGVPENMLVFDVRVVEGLVTFVPVEWSGLLVNVVNDRGTPFRGAYELVRLPSRDYVGLGLGAAISEGEQLSTWLLWPGTYMILSPGESYQARKNFVTLRLPPGQLVQYTLVMDPETGDILGAGEVALAPENLQGFDVNLIVGGSIGFNQADNVVGKAEGQVVDIAAFIESVAGFLEDNHFGYGRANIEIGGRLRLPDRPFVPTVDEINLDLLYAYRLTPWFGPYVRTSLETNMVTAYQEFDQPTTVRRYDKQGELVSESSEAELEAEIAKPFSPIELDFGVGGRLDFSAGFWLKFTTRLGLGFRQVFARELYVVESLRSGVAEIRQVDNVQQYGGEAAVILEVVPLHWLSFKADASFLVPFDDYTEPFIDLRASATLRLSSIASLIYTLRLKDDPSLIDKTQIDQTLILRFAYRLF